MMLGRAVPVLVQHVVAGLNENIAVRKCALTEIAGEVAVVVNVEQADSLERGDHRKVVARIEPIRHLFFLTPEIEQAFKQDRLWVSAIVKVYALEEWALPVIAGLSLIISAYTFRFLLGRKTFQLAGRAHSAYL